MAPGGKTLAAGRAKRGERIKLDTADWPDGPVELHLRYPAIVPDERARWAHLDWYKGDWTKQAKRLLDAADELPERPTRPDDLRLRMAAILLIDRAGGDPRTDADAAGVPAGEVHSPLFEHAEIERGTESALHAHGFLRLAWRDAVDDSAQYARAYLPPDYDHAAKDRRWPLLVVLHGYNPRNPEYSQWWNAAKRTHNTSQNTGVIAVEPHGRGNTGYVGFGSDDVIRATKRAMELFRVDPDRVYLTGYSMGGAGAWTVGSSHVHLFAAIAPIYGGWDHHACSEPEELAELTPLERFRREDESSFAMAETLLHTPTFVNQGSEDERVEPDHSRYVVRMLQRWGYPVRYWEHPGKGHGGLGCERRTVAWMLRHTLNRAPRTVRLRTADLRTARAHWLRVTQREDPYAFANAVATVVDPKTIRVDTENVLELKLDPPEQLVPRQQGARRAPSVRIFWNMKDRGQHTFARGPVTLRAEGYSPGKRRKGPILDGPIRDVQNTPFAIVEGAIAQDPRMRAFVRRVARRRLRQWERWQHVTPRYLKDAEVTDEHLEKLSLVLVGGFNANAVTRKLAGKIPLRKSFSFRLTN